MSTLHGSEIDPEEFTSHNVVTGCLQIKLALM